jgi:nitrogen fixation-related uncharacterized protein
MPALDIIEPLVAHNVLLARDSKQGRVQVNPASGVIDPHSINNTVFFILFGLIGSALVIVGIWFFFWAKNGGFYFKEDDWDDYKTTVLRRRGPNGTILSNATPSTNLGGGSIYKDVDDGKTTITDSTGLSGITAGVSNIGAREKRKLKREKKLKEKEQERRDRRKEKSKRHVGEDGALVDEDAEREAKEQLRNYRHERPARVGGINKESEASTWDGSTNPPESMAATSDLLSNRQSTPTNSPAKAGGGIRKVYSTADRREDAENARMRAEARRLAERGRAITAGRTERRDFSYQRAGEGSSSVTESALTRDEGRVPGSWVPSEVSSSAGGERGTKSYSHPIPELRGMNSTAGTESSRPRSSRRESQRRSRSGYRRGRSNSYTDDDF